MAKLRTAIFPGSFDPLTLGHVDLVERALEIFDLIVIAILEHQGKHTLFSPEERVKIIEEVFKGKRERVKIERFSGLLVDFAKVHDCEVLLRGLRAISDFDYEAQMALMNRKLSERTETLFMMAREPYSYVSSTLVKQVAHAGGSITALVPPTVAQAVKDKMEQENGKRK